MNNPEYIVIALIIWNVITFTIYWIDKYKAIKNKWRISENTLLLCAFAMGSLGGVLRHECIPS